MKFKTEIDRIKAAHYFFKYGNTQQQEKAQQMLNKVHKQYGTTDWITIKNLIY